MSLRSHQRKYSERPSLPHCHGKRYESHMDDIGWSFGSSTHRSRPGLEPQEANSCNRKDTRPRTPVHKQVHFLMAHKIHWYTRCWQSNHTQLRRDRLAQAHQGSDLEERRCLSRPVGLSFPQYRPVSRGPRFDQGQPSDLGQSLALDQRESRHHRGLTPRFS
jgi:hypothetical protein